MFDIFNFDAHESFSVVVKLFATAQFLFPIILFHPGSQDIWGGGAFGDRSSENGNNPIQFAPLQEVDGGPLGSLSSLTRIIEVKSVKKRQTDNAVKLN